MINRPVDELGRIVLPIEIRKELGIKEGDMVSIFAQDNGIFIEKSKKDLPTTL